MAFGSADDSTRRYRCPPIRFSPLYQTPGTGDAVASALAETDPESAALARAF